MILYINLTLKFKIMVDKILIFGWIALGAILVIENMVNGITWYLFLDSSANVWIIIFISIWIWIWIWVWIKWILGIKKSPDEDDDYKF